MGIEIVTQEEAEESEFLVCLRKEDQSIQHFSDNLEGECARCHKEVIFRPHAPKKPVRICIQCMLEEQNDGGANV